MKSFLTALFVCLCSIQLLAQSFTGTGGRIPDNLTAGFSFPLTVAGLSPVTLNGAHGLKTVCLSIAHPYDADLEVRLIAPDGTEAILISGAGGSGNNFTNTCLDQGSNNPVNNGTAPFTGTYKPATNLGYINNGQTGNGLWKLRVIDNAANDSGSLLSWSLTFANNAPVATPFASSNLPIIVINTGNLAIPDDPKITADMGIIFNGTGVLNHLTDPYNNYKGKIGIELRGSTSQQFPKKPYSVETRTAAGKDTDVVLLGMPAQSDWVLYASYSDKSLLNNVLAYKLFNDFGMYAPRTQFAELVLNGQYKGVYVLIEKIKRDANRVNIPKMAKTDTSGDNLTGGYIIKIDKTTGSGGAGFYSAFLPPVHPSGQKIFFQYDYPKEADIKPTQKAYIKAFVDSFETALNGPQLYDTVVGWRHFGAEKSFINMFLLNEVSKNVDGYRISNYLYKQRITNGGKLYAGPAWDYDLGFHNANYCSGDKDTGWAYRFGTATCNTDGNQVPFWWSRFMEDTTFTANLKCTYTALRASVLDTTPLFKYIDSNATYLAAAQARNFETWPILGTYVWPNPTPFPATYAGEITELKQYLKRRLAWLDAHMPGICPSIIKTGISSSTNLSSCRLYPNPFNSQLSLSVQGTAAELLSLKLMRIDGRTLGQKSIAVKMGNNSIAVFDGLESLPDGVYLLQVSGKNGIQTFKALKQ